MKKLLIALMVAILSLTMLACGGERIELKCDGENCTNVVIGKEGMDDSWIVFCEECGDIDLGD